MFGVEADGSALDMIAHIIQVALTPVFLLSGIATLLNVFSTRLSRVGDRVEAASKALEDADGDERKILSAQLKDLHRRIDRARCGRRTCRGRWSGDLCCCPRHVPRRVARGNNRVRPVRPIRSRGGMRSLRHRGIHRRNAVGRYRHSRRGSAPTAVGGRG